MKFFTDGMKFNRKESTEFEHGMDLQIPADYIYWVLVLRNDLLPEGDAKLLSLSTDQSVQKSLELTASWHPSVRVLMEDQVVDAASTLAFLTSTPDFGTDWAAQVANTRGHVTLIGDSGHPMPPVGGVGANAGFPRLCRPALETERYNKWQSEGTGHSLPGHNAGACATYG